MNILEQLVNNSKILSRKLYNIPKWIPGDTSFKNSSRYLHGEKKRKKKKSQGQMSATPGDKKLEGFFPW